MTNVKDLSYHGILVGLDHRHQNCIRAKQLLLLVVKYHGCELISDHLCPGCYYIMIPEYNTKEVGGVCVCLSKHYIFAITPEVRTMDNLYER